MRSTRRGPPGPLDELLPDHPLELGDLLADGGLRVAELTRSQAERAVPGDGVERHEMAELDAASIYHVP